MADRDDRPRGFWREVLLILLVMALAFLVATLFG
jgi:hypothetical protein